MVVFIDAHRDAYGVEPICAELPIAPSTYHLAKAREADPTLRPARAQRDAGLCEAIQRVWDENFQVYGTRKVWQRKLPRQVDTAKRDWPADKGLGRNVSGGTRPRLSWGRSLL